MKRYLMELIGTLFLTLAVTLTGNVLSMGLMLAVLAYIGGHISGAHYNPAVSVGVWLRNGIKTDDLLKYTLCQVVGAFMAMYMYSKLTGNHFSLEDAQGVDHMWAFAMEMVLTALFVWSFLTLTMSSKFKNGEIYGLAIGLALVAVLAFGGVFNPAIALSSNLCIRFCGGEMLPLKLMAVYLGAPLIGGALASMAYDYFGKKA